MKSRRSSFPLAILTRSPRNTADSTGSDMLPLQIGDLVRLVGGPRNSIGVIKNFNLDEYGETWFDVWFSHIDNTETFTADWLNKVS